MSVESKKLREVPQSVALMIVALPVLVAYALLAWGARPLPFFDDYLCIFGFAVPYSQLPTAGQKFLFIFGSQFNEYKLAFEHVFIAADLAATGHIHFGYLIWAGNLLLVFLPLVFWGNWFPNAGLPLWRRLLGFAPIVYLVFQMNYVETLDWAMCGLQTVPVIVFTLAALHFVIRRTPVALALACVFALLCPFGSVNGFLMWPMGMVLLFTERRWRAMLAWTAAFGLAFVGYSYRWHWVPARPAAPLGTEIMFFLSFTGAALENMHRRPVPGLSALVGLVVVFVAVYGWRKKLYRTAPFFFYSTLWCLITAAAVTKGRSSGGVFLALSGRYKIYCDVALACVYGLFAQRIRELQTPERTVRRVYAVALASTVLLCLGSDAIAARFLARKDRAIPIGLRKYAADPAHNSPIEPNSDDALPLEYLEAGRVGMNQAIAAGIYELPAEYRR